MTTKGRHPMQRSFLRLTFLVAALPLAAACNRSTPNDLDNSGGGGDGGGSNGAGVVVVDDAPGLGPKDAAYLSTRARDYSESLRTASLKLVRGLPTLAQIKHVGDAKGDANKRAAYEQELDAMFADPRFQERMIKWWKDVMRMGGAAQNGKPSRDSAPIFAARVMAEEAPSSDLFTAKTNTCPSYDYDNHAFVDGDCDNGVSTHAGVLTNPGVMHQFYGSMAFRRVRWLQEIFVCTKFPAEYSETPVHKGSADYTSPWKFESVATAPIDFQDTKSVICANCHTTINHLAPLFGNFDENGDFKAGIQVMTPTAPDAIPTEMGHWLAPGEKTYWRLNTPAVDLPALGAAVAADTDVAECAVARMWNFAMSKEDIVSDLATVPLAVLEPFIAEFHGNGQNLKQTLRSMLTSDDFLRF
ncbi:MAG: hypothetical protein ABI193_11630 [Minicystis sp.]